MDEDGTLQARVKLLQREKQHNMTNQLSENLVERLQRATLHCRGNAKNLTMPPTELFCQDTRGLKMKQEVDLRNFTNASNEWLFTIASHPAANGSSTFRTLVLAGTSITDTGILPRIDRRRFEHHPTAIEFTPSASSQRMPPFFQYRSQ
ncbi:hypothetical protein PPTG_18938 [Phytophthora nicotianae INRA-310]|uniref:Uncharacterized protein n=1 Tax=Phytophthora nicotianae (strain INRA-310) TaxID=761204 RepID=W2PEA6_PHYN3|nr:hypothetical protein PPTG_18938 [Phytophthora nicotianae INRA-310]ETM99191.1 hypothetical protein PPTG_18938 [Phytophthora nicotianae INRA-310]